jgi:hypothetical protein
MLISRLWIEQALLQDFYQVRMENCCLQNHLILMLMTYMGQEVAVAASLFSHVSAQASEENNEHFVAR